MRSLKRINEMSKTKLNGTGSCTSCKHLYVDEEQDEYCNYYDRWIYNDYFKREPIMFPCLKFKQKGENK